MKKAALSAVKDDLSKFLRVAEKEEVVIPLELELDVRDLEEAVG